MAVAQAPLAEPELCAGHGVAVAERSGVGLVEAVGDGSTVTVCAGVAEAGADCADLTVGEGVAVTDAFVAADAFVTGVALGVGWLGETVEPFDGVAAEAARAAATVVGSGCAAGAALAVIDAVDPPAFAAVAAGDGVTAPVTVFTGVDGLVTGDA